MPYKRVGKTIMHKKDGWSKKQTAGSVEKAKATMNLLHGIEHGWKPTGESAKHHSPPTNPKFDNPDKY